jgi:uncharacterized protein YecT (DUF1311 family)
MGEGQARDLRVFRESAMAGRNRSDCVQGLRARIKELACIAALLASPAWAGDSAAEKFGARTWPAKPVLTTNKDSEVCARLIDIAERHFLSAEVAIDFAAAVLNELPKVEWVEFADVKGDGSLKRADLSLDGDGIRQTVVYRDNAFNWKGNWHYAYVFPSTSAFEAAKESVIAEWSDRPKDGQYPSAGDSHFGATQYFPSARNLEGKPLGTGDVWGEHSLFEIAGRYYFVPSQNDFDRLSPDQLPVHRLRASGRVELVCVVSFNWQHTAHLKLSELPAIESVIAIMRQIGNPGPDQGTMHSASLHTARGTASEVSVASRPWVIAAADDMPTERFLDDWGYEEPWNRREIELLKVMRSTAEGSYSSYLQRDFGMSTKAADAGARAAVAAIVGGWLRIPQGYEESAEYYFERRRLTVPALDRDRAAFDALLKHATNPQYSRTLFDALEWPYAVDRLLELGADPNFENESGKTALMMAAHLDRIDTVRKLLKAGARVNERMHGSEIYGELVTQRIDRTALMYAAENASPRVLDVLLRAGEKADAKDSRGNGIGFYLSNNPRYANEEWRAGIDGVLKGIPKSLDASFGCREAKTRIEKTICGSEALAIFDAEIAAAFQRLKQKEGLPALAQQRAWLAERNRRCARADDESCLGDTMRTQMRYLHTRLRE